MKRIVFITLLIAILLSACQAQPVYVVVTATDFSPAPPELVDTLTPEPTAIDTLTPTEAPSPTQETGFDLTEVIQPVVCNETNAFYNVRNKPSLTAEIIFKMAPALCVWIDYPAITMVDGNVIFIQVFEIGSREWEYGWTAINAFGNQVQQ